jgi:DNA repair protein RecO (recombination protein O)
MPSYNATGIVIRRTAFGETDNILALYTREYGRIAAIAKGARKPLSRLSGASEMLTCSRFCLASGKGMPVVTQAEVKNSFPRLRKELPRLASGLYFAELLSRFVADEDPIEDLFVLLRASLLLMERVPSPDTGARWFELRLMDEVGYAPDLSACAVCGETVDVDQAERRSEAVGLSAENGGVLCALHATSLRTGDSSLSGEALAYLRQLAKMGLNEIRRVIAVPSPTERGSALARMAMRAYIRYRLERDLKSLEFLDSVT